MHRKGVQNLTGKEGPQPSSQPRATKFLQCAGRQRRCAEQAADVEFREMNSPLAVNVPSKIQDLIESKLKRSPVCNETPVLALVFSPSWEVIGQSSNSREMESDPTGHAEVLAIREAAKRLGTWKLDSSTLFSSLQPCIMCSSVIREARISRVIYCVESASAAHHYYDLLRDSRLPGAPVEVIKLPIGEASTLESKKISGFFGSLRQKKIESKFS